MMQQISVNPVVGWQKLTENMHTEALAHTPTASETQECRGASTTQNTPPTSMISVSHLEPGPHQRSFIASLKRLVVWWPGEGILCWDISMTSSRLIIEPTQRLCKVTFDTLSLCFFSLSTGPKLSTLPNVWFFLELKSTMFSLRRSCVWVIPFQGKKLKTHMYQASPTTTPWQA